MKKTAGSLFRGQYKAILIERDAYLLNVSRHRHLNPVVAGLVERASDYPWSSYSAYVDKELVPAWLHSHLLLAMIGQSHRRERYRKFVEAGIDEETATFYGKKKLSPILGSDVIRQRMLSNSEDNPAIPEKRQALARPSLPLIVTAVAKKFSVCEEAITRGARVRGKRDPGRTADIYIARTIAGYPLIETASYFGLKDYASASGVVTRYRNALEIDTKLANTIDAIAKEIRAKI